MPSPNPGGTRGVSVLNGVAATSAANAWAVGYYAPRGSPLRTLIVHWDGTAWKQQSSPGSGTNSLGGVAATSSTNAWAVGSYSNGGIGHTLVLHCC